MDPKISLRASARITEYPDAVVSLLLHAYHPTSSDMCLKKKIAPLVALGSLEISL